MWTDKYVFWTTAFVTFVGWYAVGCLVCAILTRERRSDAVGVFFGHPPDKGIPWWGRLLQAYVLALAAGVLVVLLTATV